MSIEYLSALFRHFCAKLEKSEDLSIASAFLIPKLIVYDENFMFSNSLEKVTID